MKGPIINNEPTSPIKAFTNKKADIDYIRIWGCQYVVYINPKLLLAGSRHNKLVLRGREAVFISYSWTTNK